MAHETVSVTGLELLGGHRVRLLFDDGAARDRDLDGLLHGPVFERIRSVPSEFAQVAIDSELGVLVWPNGADIDAELLRYDDLWESTVPSARAV